MDTSVWIEFFRGTTQSVVSTMHGLLDRDAVLLPKTVMLELVSGANKRDAAKLKFYVSALALIYPKQSTWDLLEPWIDLARAKGERFGIMDLLIAAQAREQNAAIWSFDKDFQRMAQLKLVSLF